MPVKESSSAPMPFDAPVDALPGVGKSSVAKLQRLGIETTGDLVLHLPFRYQDRTRSVPLDEVQAGQECLVTGCVATSSIAYGRRRSLMARIEDDAGALTLRWFHFSSSQRQAMQPGVWLRCFGEVRPGPTGLEMPHPDYRLHHEQPGPPAGELTPIYRVTQGLASARLAKWVTAALANCQDLPCSSLDGFEFTNLLDAIGFLHAPSDEIESSTEDSSQASAAGLRDRLQAARHRVVLDELVGHYLILKRRKALVQAQAARALPSKQQLGREMLDQLGFRLTRAQARVVGEVLTDLAAERPMMRLVQGDVGAGKTVVAAFAAIRAAEHGCQTAVMAPTEILAEQHFETLSQWLPPLGIGVGLITGRQSAAERRARLAAIADGGDLVVVGTHALFQSGVQFHRLALAVIDEQHRFGVHQRMQLRDKGNLPHQLVMTATPIPRTLTMAFYADMDISTIDELPPGRLPVRTHLASMARRAEVIERVVNACAAGKQVYWVCTAIEEEAEIDGRPRSNAALATLEELSQAVPENLRLGLVHGRLLAAEKRAAMAAFKAGETDILVATTVIEVGVDVPNATVMIIDNAERLGLAQLHQLRGRVGRGSQQSECILLFEPPLSAVARQRLSIMRETNDGFRIAEKDLELRGPGDILGTRQTGEQTFKLVDMAKDRTLLPQAVKLGDRLLAEDPPMAQLIVDTWLRGETEYATV